MPSAVMGDGEAVMVVLAAVAGPATKATLALSVIEAAFSVPLTVAVPFAVDDVSRAVYVPSPLSAKLDNVPAFELRAIVSPPVVRLLPLASLACTVMVVLETPSAVIEDGVAVTVDVAAEASPGTNSTLALSVMSVPSSVPVIVAVSAVVDDVSVAE